MNPLNNILAITSKDGTRCIELESFEHKTPSENEKIEDLIKHYDDFLEELAIPRAKINELKKAKDIIVKQYIYETKAPKTLELSLLNYKALLFYFKDSFIKRSLILKFNHYSSNDFSQIQQEKKNNLVNYFCNGEINIKLNHNNFPHLIGIRKPLDDNGNIINHNFIEDFLDDIFYETKVLEDYKAHRGDENKIKTFSWIYATLRNPTMILEHDAIKEDHSNFESDLIFVRKLFGSTEYAYHLVGISRQDQCNYFIKSQFPIKTERVFNKKFNKRKKIYQWLREGRS